MGATAKEPSSSLHKASTACLEKLAHASNSAARLAFAGGSAAILTIASASPHITLAIVGRQPGPEIETSIASRSSSCHQHRRGAPPAGVISRRYLARNVERYSAASWSRTPSTSSAASPACAHRPHAAWPIQLV